MNISKEIRNMAADAERDLADIFRDIDSISEYNTEKVLDVFRQNRISEATFSPSTGYGYSDTGRDTADRTVADIFGAEAGFIRHSIASGTHALTIGLFALLRPGDTVLFATGVPYDTILDVIGIDQSGKETVPAKDGSLADFGIKCRIADLSEDRIDTEKIKEILGSDPTVKVIYFQRSCGYSERRTLTSDEIRTSADELKKFAEASSGHRVFTMVDNCYGEFCEKDEPSAPSGTSEGVDLMVGSLIKNPGGGVADCGGYIVGSKEAVELAGYRLTCPGVGLEVGASLGQTRNILRGLFLAPAVVASAMKTAHLAAYIFARMGLHVSPAPEERRSDIIQKIDCATPEGLASFCKGIQSSSPVDSYVTPEAWEMPGYEDPVIMAAGAFVGGSSIELSCDGPMREPYTAFLQGGVTYQSGKLGIMSAAQALKDGRTADGNA